MNAPLIWIIFPLSVAAVIWLLRNERAIAIAGSLISLLLAAMAARLPIETAVEFGSMAFRIAPTFEVLGRKLILTSTSQPVLVIIYGVVAFWFLGTLATEGARRIVPLGLSITALLVASLAVEPFLYAAPIIEMATLLCIPLLAPPDQKPGRGILRFLAYQTLAVPFILLSGFLLAGVEASPADTSLVLQAATLLGIGFALLLAVFPFHSWIPMLAEEAAPYTIGFILLLFPTINLLFGMGFLDRYTWLREAPMLKNVLQTTGLIMLCAGGFWSAFQSHLGRMMGYAVIAQTGMALLALGIGDQSLGVALSFAFIIPRAFALGMWALALATLKGPAPSLLFTDVKGLLRSYPLAAGGLVLASLSLTGFPLLANFPFTQILWEHTARLGMEQSLWFGLGILGLGVGGIRMLAVLAMSPDETAWVFNETWLQRTLLGLGWLGLFLLGLFPQWTQPLIVNLPAVFERLGR
jgi:formate hydrogenlyase subunit 3/multisubunit Na+/H+ antiporter MnhD subunit